MTAFIEHYPVVLRPIDTDGLPAAGEPIDVFQLRPGDQQRLIDWSGMVGYPGADGGVLLLNDGTVVAQVQLGEFLIRDSSGMRVETDAAALFRAYQPG